MHAYIFDGEKVEQTADPAVIHAAHLARRPLWVDLEQRSPDAERVLAETFAIHPLVVEDIWADRSVPKVDSFASYLYVVANGVRRNSTPGHLELAVLDLVIGESFLLTQHGGSLSVEAVRAELGRSPRLLRDGIPWLTHALLDHLVDRFLPLIDEVGAQIDLIEREVVEGTGVGHDRDMLTRIFSLKRSVHKLLRIARHQKEVLLRLSSGDLPAIPADAIPFYRDVLDHFARVTDLAELYHEVIESALDAYLSVQANKMNQDVKRLTLISTVMLPLSFIAAVYGMNFRYMPETEWRYGYVYVLCLMASVATGIVWYFKRKRWM